MNQQEYENIKAQNLDLARGLANSPHVRPVEEFFIFSIPHEGEALRLRYRWDEVWPLKKLEEFRAREKLSMESAKRLNEERTKDIDPGGEFIEI